MTITERARDFAEGCPRGEHTDFLLGKTVVATVYRYCQEVLPDHYLVTWLPEHEQFYDNVGVDGAEAAAVVLVDLAVQAIERRLVELLEAVRG